jgi:hypothetical protein
MVKKKKSGSADNLTISREARKEPAKNNRLRGGRQG